MTLVRDATEVDGFGEVATLPQDQWIDEWDRFAIEIWATVDDTAGQFGVHTVSTDLVYDKSLFTATEIEYGTAFHDNQTGQIDAAAGRVNDIGGTTRVFTVDPYTAAPDLYPSLRSRRREPLRRQRARARRPGVLRAESRRSGRAVGRRRQVCRADRRAGLRVRRRRGQVEPRRRDERHDPRLGGRPGLAGDLRHRRQRHRSTWATCRTLPRPTITTSATPARRGPGRAITTTTARWGWATSRSSPPTTAAARRAPAGASTRRTSPPIGRRPWKRPLRPSGNTLGPRAMRPPRGAARPSRWPRPSSIG